MEAAVLAVLSGAGYQETAREFGVSISTLLRRVRDGNSLVSDSSKSLTR